MNNKTINNYLVIGLGIVMLLVSACVPLEPVTLTAATAEEPVETVMLDPTAMEANSRAFFSTMLAGDMDGWLATLDKDAVSYEPVGTPPNVGHDGLLAWAASLSGFESVHIELHQLFVAGNSVAVVWTSTFTLPGGEAIAIDGVDIHEYNSAGTIQTIKGYFDPMPLMAAMNPGSSFHTNDDGSGEGSS